MRRWNGCLLSAALAAGLALPACGQYVSNRVMQIVVPTGTCAAVHDASGTLVIGQRGLADNQLTFYQLDASGIAATTTPVRVTLPRADALKAFAYHPLALAFHPRLPLLYVWQDVAGPDIGVPANNPVFTGFDHLLIYAVKAGAPPQLLQSHARGPSYAYGQAFGALAIDPAGKKIFMPNLRHPVSGRAAIGFFFLDTNGMPRVIDGGVEPATPLDVADFRGHPTGFGFVVVTNNVVIFTGPYGPALWDMENRRAAIGTVLIRGMQPDCFVGGDPRWPAVFGCSVNVNPVFRMEQVDGYLTMLPQVYNHPTATFQMAPVAMPGNPNRIAIGGANFVHVLTLDAEYKLGGMVEDIPVFNPSVRAMAYSEKFGRLYVAVEKLP